MNEIQAAQATTEPQLSAELQSYCLLLASKSGVTLTAPRKKKFLNCTDKNQVNRIFFDSVEAWKKETVLFTPEQKAASKMLSVKFDVTKSNQYIKLTQDITYFRNEYHAKIEAASGHLQDLVQCSTELVALENKTPENLLNITDLIEKACASGFYTFELEQSEKVGAYVFYTAPIYLSYKNATAGVNIDNCGLGRFKVILNLISGSCKVLRLSKNTEVGSFYHPHVHNNGGVCWGNGAKVVSDSFLSYDLVTILQTLQIVLTNYNDASPYVALYKFHRQTNPEHYPLTYKFISNYTLYINDYNNDFTTLDSQQILRLHFYENEDAKSDGDVTSISPPIDFQQIASDYDFSSFAALAKNISSVEVNAFRAYRLGELVDSTAYYKLGDGTYKKYAMIPKLDSGLGF